jgi:aminoglycoside 3-N-acetyltransferase
LIPSHRDVAASRARFFCVSSWTSAPNVQTSNQRPNSTIYSAGFRGRALGTRANDDRRCGLRRSADPSPPRAIGCDVRPANVVQSRARNGTGQLNSGAAQAIRKEVKRQLRMLRQRFIRTFYTFTPADLRACLAEIGIERGDSVLVHSSFDAFEGFTGKPTDVIAVLMDAVGPEGTLLMPTLPFTGTAVAWVKENPIFDVARTPSRMGLITELFRRSPGVMRSVHPTHPVAAWGKDAEAYVAGHHLARTPCGQGSPFARLLERAGKILLLGVDIGSMTFYHCVEELLEPRFPVSPFTREIYQLSSRQKDGTIVATQTRLFEPDVSRRRSLYRLAPELKRRGAWKSKRIGRVTTTLLNPNDILDVVATLAERGIYCYD